MSSFHPYAERYGVNRAHPREGHAREEVLAELATMATEEDATWETGKCSGTMYCGDHEHYDFMTEAFGLFAHVNALQRDMCPSATQLRGRDHRHDPRPAPRRARSPTASPCGLVTTGGTGSILPRGARLPRARPRRPAASTSPNVVKPETAHPAFDKACHLFGVEVRNAPIDPETTQVDVDCDGRPDRRQHDRPRRLGLQLRLRHDRPDRGAVATSRSSAASACTSTAASAGSSSRWARSSATTSRCSTSALPGVTTHLGRHPQVRLRRSRARRCVAFRDKALRNAQYFFLTDWTGGKYCSPGIEGSRSGGLLAATWAAMVTHRPRGLPAATPRRSSRPPTR